jgi:hypothetical protein
MKTGENNFLSQTQSFRQYIFAGSLNEYSEERKELQPLLQHLDLLFEN